MIYPDDCEEFGDKEFEERMIELAIRDNPKDTDWLPSAMLKAHQRKKGEYWNVSGTAELNDMNQVPILLHGVHIQQVQLLAISWRSHMPKSSPWNGSMHAPMKLFDAL